MVVLFIALFTMACQQTETQIVFTNDTSIERIDEPVVISRSDLEKQTGEISTRFVPMLVAENGMVIPSQVDDINGDAHGTNYFYWLTFPPTHKPALQYRW